MNKIYSSNSSTFEHDAGIILHYNGSVWSEMDSGITEYLSGVWGSSSSDVFAVGSDGIILHYDGNTWSTMNCCTTESLMDIWGSSASDVFAVGNEGNIWHYDGNLWSKID